MTRGGGGGSKGTRTPTTPLPLGGLRPIVSCQRYRPKESTSTTGTCVYILSTRSTKSCNTRCCRGLLPCGAPFSYGGGGWAIWIDPFLVGDVSWSSVLTQRYVEDIQDSWAILENLLNLVKRNLQGRVAPLPPIAKAPHTSPPPHRPPPKGGPLGVVGIQTQGVAPRPSNPMCIANGGWSYIAPPSPVTYPQVDWGGDFFQQNECVQV